MKINKNTFIPIIVISLVCLLALIVQKIPLFLVLSMWKLCAVLITILDKSNNNLRKTFVVGIILAIIYSIILINVFSLANHYEWLKDIILWPLWQFGILYNTIEYFVKSWYDMDKMY